MNSKMKIKKRMGQATIEYLFLMIFIAFIGVGMINTLRDTFSYSIGRIAHVLSVKLASGVCAEFCFYPDYKNGWKDK